MASNGEAPPPSKRAKLIQGVGSKGTASPAAAAPAEEEPVEARDPWKQPCSEAFKFHLVEACTEKELNEEIARGGLEFDAEFFHQHFGDDEIVKGYRGLEVHLWFSASTYHAWVEVSFKQKKMGADQIVKILSEYFPGGLHRLQQDFVSAVVTSAAQLLACLAAQPSHLGTHMQTLHPPGRIPLRIQHYKLTEAPQEVQDLHARFEPLMLFFIDGASLIEKDEKWEVLLGWQMPAGAPAAGAEAGPLQPPSPCHPPLLLGLTTLYHFWAYPDASRLRLSQILVLPPYRDLGLGKAMMAAAYHLARERHCIDLTVEDPTPNLQRVREKLELEQLQLGCPWLLEQAKACAEAAVSGTHAWPHRPIPTPPPRGAPTPAGPSHAASEAPSTDLLNSAAMLGPPGAGAPPAGVASGPRGSSASPNSQNANNNSSSSKQHTPGRGAAAPQSGGGTRARRAAPHLKKQQPPGGGTSAGYSAPACLSPPVGLLVALTHELKVYVREARQVWEALLFLQPGLWEAAAGRQALRALVLARLEATHFVHCAADAEHKQLVPLSRDTQRHDDNFIMCRVKAEHLDALQKQEQAAATGTSQQAGKAVASGRLSVTLMSAEEKEARLGEMWDERLEQLKTLKSLLARTTKAQANKA